MIYVNTSVLVRMSQSVHWLANGVYRKPSFQVFSCQSWQKIQLTHSFAIKESSFHRFISIAEVMRAESILAFLFCIYLWFRSKSNLLQMEASKYHHNHCKLNTWICKFLCFSVDLPVRRQLDQRQRPTVI